MSRQKAPIISQVNMPRITQFLHLDQKECLHTNYYSIYQPTITKTNVYQDKQAY